MDAALPTVASQASFASWGRGDAGGLRTFDGGSNKATAQRWKNELLEGTPGRPSLVSTHNSGEPTFVCPSRLSVLEFIAPRLSLLDAGELGGQNNCCVVFGTRELGKSTFLSSIAHVVALVAAPTTGVVALNFKTEGVSEPLHALQRLLALGMSGPSLGDATGDISSVLQVMVDNSRRAVLFIDDVEALFRMDADSALAAQVFQQLVAMGRWGGTRPVVVVLTGSAAVLRSLLFCNSSANIAHEFPCHLRFGSLNHSKFVPLTLRPVVDSASLERAILCLAGQKALLASLVHSGDFVMPEGTAGAVCSADPVADNCSVTPILYERIALLSRGIAGHIAGDCRGQLKHEHRLERLLGPDRAPSRLDALRRLVAGWENSICAAGGDVVAVATAAKSHVCKFSLLLRDTEPSTVWYSLADMGLVAFDDTSMPRAVRFLHPTDAGALIVALCSARALEPRVLEPLTPPECVSLLAPRLACACDFNESLVMESLAWTSCEPQGLVLSDGSVLRRLRHSRGAYCMLSYEGGTHTIDDLVQPDRRGVLCKEYPDEHGGDGACLLDPGSLQLCIQKEDGSSAPTAAAAPGMPYVLLRVHVKMTSALMASSISPTDVTAMTAKLAASSAALIVLLSASLRAPVVARHVFWVSQYLSHPAHSALTADGSCSLVVRPGPAMLMLWSPRVRHFVERRGLVQYGAVAVPPPQSAPEGRSEKTRSVVLQRS